MRAQHTASRQTPTPLHPPTHWQHEDTPGFSSWVFLKSSKWAWRYLMAVSEGGVGERV